MFVNGSFTKIGEKFLGKIADIFYIYVTIFEKYLKWLFISIIIILIFYIL